MNSDRPKLHVALVAPAWPPELSSNGIVTYVRWMRQGLLARGCRVSVVAFAVAPECVDADVHQIAAEKSAVAALLWIANRVTGKKPSAYDCGAQIASTIARVHAVSPIDIIEMEESFGWAATVAQATRLPVVVKLHGPAFLHLVEEELETPFGQEKVRREGAALAQLPYLVSPSRGHLVETLARYALVPSIAEHLVNPLATDRDAKLWDRASCDPHLLLFVGRFDKVKGGDVVIRAFQMLWRKQPALRLLFVGPDPGLLQPDGTRIGIEQFIAGLGGAEFASSVRVCGRLPPASIAAFRTQAACTVVASRCESQGYTALEAMLQGCPLVCTDASGLRELVDDGRNGLKVRVGDAEDLAVKVEQILASPDLAASLGAQARRFVLEHHDPEGVAARALEIYAQAISMSAAAAAKA